MHPGRVIVEEAAGVLWLLQGMGRMGGQPGAGAALDVDWGCCEGCAGWKAPAEAHDDVGEAKREHLPIKCGEWRDVLRRRLDER